MSQVIDLQETWNRLSILFPFIATSSNPYVPPSQLSAPPPLIATTSLSIISRTQLIDALVKLSQDKRPADGDEGKTDILVTEVCIEYVGRRWREGVDKGEVMVHDIATKLTEVDFEVGRLTALGFSWLIFLSSS